MCQSKQDGGLRCSSHMRKALDAAQAEAALTNSEAAYRRVREAQNDYDRTPQGIKDLQASVAATHGRVSKQTMSELMDRLSNAEKDYEVLVRAAGVAKAAHHLDETKRLEVVHSEAAALTDTLSYSYSQFLEAQPIPDETRTVAQRKESALADLRALDFLVNIAVQSNEQHKELGFDGSKNGLWAKEFSHIIDVVGPNRSEAMALVLASFTKHGLSVQFAHTAQSSLIQPGRFSAKETRALEAAAPNTARARLRELSKSKSLHSSLAKNVSAPVDVLSHVYDKWVAKGEYNDVPIQLAGNPSTPKRILTSMAAHREASVRSIAAESKHLPTEKLVSLLRDDDKDVRGAARSNENFADAARFYVASESGTFDPEAYASLRELPNSYVVDMADTMLAD